jgi:hypothetical protein
MVKIISMFVIGYSMLYTSAAHAGGVWSDQYCNLVTETIVTKDQTGKVIDSTTKEVMKCDDGAKDFLAYSGIAKDCNEFVYSMNLKGHPVQRKGYACQKFDGSWEVVRHPHARK